MRHRRLARSAVISVRGSIGINIRAIKHSGISLPHVLSQPRQSVVGAAREPPTGSNKSSGGTSSATSESSTIAAHAAATTAAPISARPVRCRIVAPPRPMRLSVIIPVYNEEQTIHEVLERVAAVDLGGNEMEIVIANHGSTDGGQPLPDGC